MKKMTKTLVAAAVLAASSSAAMAEVSADLTISSMYLWRGMDISEGAPAVSSTIQYDDESGFYVGTWMSSEGASGSYEIDAYAGYGTAIGEVGVDVGYALYMYPQVAGDIGDSDIAEYIVGLSYKDLGFTAYVNAEPDDFDDYVYYSLDYSIDKFGLHYGMTDVKSDNDYTDISVSYAATEELTWTISSASGDGIDNTVDDDGPLVMVSYSVPLK